MEKEIFTAREVWEGLLGKKIVLAGNECRQKQVFWENLAYISGSLGKGFFLSSDLREADAESFVFLFSNPEKMKDLDDLLEQLQHVAVEQPRAVALISDNRVYGKIYGESHFLKPHEIGYACHTMAEDILVTNLRTAEHFACRLARELGLNIRVARADASQSGDSLERIIEAAADVLLRGVPGEVYNLPVLSSGIGQEHSPLAPIAVVTQENIL